MKKIILFAFIAISTISYGQKLVVTPTGLRDANDLEKTFVVINADGKTSKELYDNALKYINKNYKSPDDVIKGKTDGEYLKFVTYAPDFISIKNSWVRTPFNAKYTIGLSFKDGKVKYEVIDIEIENGAKAPLLFSGSGLNFFIYNKKGELKREDAKISIEDYFNSNISTLSDFLQSKNVNDKW